MHEHIDDMNRKSEIVNLGVVHPIPCFGDGHSVERMCDAKRARAGGENSHRQT